jgi:SMC interacting uncharacterized protein involved in chromosome segregation
VDAVSSFPWDYENDILADHKQPCDCAICDEIHFQRLMRKKRRKEMETEAVYGSMSVNEQLNREIDRLKAEVERLQELNNQYKRGLERIANSISNDPLFAYKSIKQIAREALEGK